MKIEEYLNYLNSFFYPFFATIITPAIISHFSHLKKTHYGIGFFPSASVITSTITCYHLKSNKFINFFIFINLPYFITRTLFAVPSSSIFFIDVRVPISTSIFLNNFLTIFKIFSNYF